MASQPISTSFPGLEDSPSPPETADTAQLDSARKNPMHNKSSKNVPQVAEEIIRAIQLT